MQDPNFYLEHSQKISMRSVIDTLYLIGPEWVLI